MLVPERSLQLIPESVKDALDDEQCHSIPNMVNISSFTLAEKDVELTLSYCF